MGRISLALALGLVVLPLAAGAAFPQSQGVVAVVNDQAITERDITQRIAILRILGDGSLSRKAALQDLVDEQVKLAEAKKYNMAAAEGEIDAQVARMAKNLNTDTAGLIAKFKKQGISEAAFRRYIAASIGFNRIIGAKYRANLTVTEADVDAKYAEIKNTAGSRMAEIMKDPRMKPVTVYVIMEINLPIDGDDAALVQSRAAEANVYAKRFKGCDSARQAADGIYNVKIGKKIEAEASRLPKQMRAALDQAGPGAAIGPMRTKDSIQLLAYCGTRKITPPKPKFEMPTREQVRNLLINEMYDKYEGGYMKTARASAYIEYRDPSFSQ